MSRLATPLRKNDNVLIIAGRDRGKRPEGHVHDGDVFFFVGPKNQVRVRRPALSPGAGPNVGDRLL